MFEHITQNIVYLPNETKERCYSRYQRYLLRAKIIFTVDMMDLRHPSYGQIYRDTQAQIAIEMAYDRITPRMACVLAKYLQRKRMATK